MIKKFNYIKSLLTEIFVLVLTIIIYNISSIIYVKLNFNYAKVNYFSILLIYIFVIYLLLIFITSLIKNHAIRTLSEIIVFCLISLCLLSNFPKRLFLLLICYSIFKFFKDKILFTRIYRQ